MTATVHPFACNRHHPQLGDKVLCTRQRFHAGDHRADDDGTLRAWPDQALEPMGRQAGKVSGAVSDGAGDWIELEGHVHRDPLWVAALLVLVAVLLAAPAVLVILYREAF